MKQRFYTDIIAMIGMIIAIISGLLLHNEVHHLHVYNDITLWRLHEIIGVVIIESLIMHCIQHKYWFTNYKKLPINKKRITTILLILGVIVVLSGIILMAGSHSKFISILHYGSSIIFAIIAIGHVAKRWKIFISITKSKV